MHSSQVLVDTSAIELFFCINPLLLKPSVSPQLPLFERFASLLDLCEVKNRNPSQFYTEVSYDIPIVTDFWSIGDTMKAFLLGLVLSFAQFCHGQLKGCFLVDGEPAQLNFPCDPSANVSI